MYFATCTQQLCRKKCSKCFVKSSEGSPYEPLLLLRLRLGRFHNDDGKCLGTGLKRLEAPDRIRIRPIKSKRSLVDICWRHVAEEISLFWRGWGMNLFRTLASPWTATFRKIGVWWNMMDIDVQIFSRIIPWKCQNMFTDKYWEAGEDFFLKLLFCCCQERLSGQMLDMEWYYRHSNPPRTWGFVPLGRL